MKFPRNAKVFRGQLDAAPFAAVLFLLLIFLLLNSTLITVPGVRIALPETPALPGVANPTLVVAVDLNGQYYFERQVVPEEKLRTLLQAAVREAQRPVTLVVQADKGVSVDTAVVRLSQLARSAGIREILLATRDKLFPDAPRPEAR